MNTAVKIKDLNERQILWHLKKPITHSYIDWDATPDDAEEDIWVDTEHHYVVTSRAKSGLGVDSEHKMFACDAQGNYIAWLDEYYSSNGHEELLREAGYTTKE